MTSSHLHDPHEGTDSADVVAHPSRRDVLGSAVAAGLVSMSLPRAVQAASVEGAGGYVPPNSAPARITDLAATAGPGSITLTFTTPNDNGTSITEYRVYRTVDDVATSFSTHSGSAGPIVIDVLDPTVAYTFSVSAMNVHGEAERSSTVVETPGAVATGGTVTYFTADGTNGTNGIRYAVHTFVDSGGSAINSNLILSASRSVDYLVVAGGGSGGTAGTTNAGVWGTGGGGAGGVRQGSGLALVDGTYAVTVGGSRAAPSRSNTLADNQGLTGNASSFHSYTASGGGAGGTQNVAGGSGGSGGGGGGRKSTSGGSGNAGSYSPVEGRAGGNARSDDLTGTSGGGGGGGAGAAGSNSGGTSSSSAGGDGGAGIQSNIDGTSRFVAGGGGGGAEDTRVGATETAGSGGDGGGGAGSTTGNATSGTNGTGGGGGGVGITGVGGSGGSGIVVVRYPITKLTY